ncbi:hypothetical protein PF596_03420 [Streptococcus thermophilus]|uniref:hypothetical protein n=1 Tax=Streptococcus thermophilus TaxID=1308 RepID=UPI0022EA2DAA|nr:hypothetical protein [Streptococcus thermophilus]MDA3773881.1 hypothetical protein [Streptococcus thermophilus]
MSKQGLKSGAFFKYYFGSLASLSLLGFIFYVFYSSNGFISLSSERTSVLEVNHYSGQLSPSSVKKDGVYKVQDISGETNNYDIDLRVTNEGDKVIQTYIFEYKK